MTCVEDQIWEEHGEYLCGIIILQDYLLGESRPRTIETDTVLVGRAAYAIDTR